MNEPKLNPHFLELLYDIPLGLSEWMDVLLALKNEMQASLVFIVVKGHDQDPIFLTSSSSSEQLHQMHSAIEQLMHLVSSASEQLNENEGHHEWYEQQKQALLKEISMGFGVRVEMSEEFYLEPEFQLHLGVLCDRKFTVDGDYNKLLLKVCFRHVRRVIALLKHVALKPMSLDLELGDQYGLTRAEVSMLTTYVKNRSLTLTAQELNRSYQAVRTQMSRVLEKVNARNQHDLITKLIAGKPANVSWEPKNQAPWASVASQQ